MTKRKKRLEKGILSLEEQKIIHEQKKEKAAEEGRLELETYYTKEIKRIEERIKDRKRKLETK